MTEYRETRIRSRYRAFISYSHAVDGKLAPALQYALQVIAKPLFRSRSFEIFRDAADLSTSPDLWGSIVSAMDDSEHLVLLASPAAAGSKWVGREIAHWLTSQPVDSIILTVTEGDYAWAPELADFDWERSSAIPRALSKVFPGEPLLVDLRHLRTASDLSLDNPRFVDALQPIAARLHRKTVDELFGEINLQHRRTLRIRNIVIFVLLLLLSVALLATAGMQRARDTEAAARRLAEDRRLQADDQARIVIARQWLDRDPTVSGLLLQEVVRPKQMQLWLPVALEAVRRPQALAVLRGHNKELLDVRFARDGKHVVTSSKDLTVRVWSHLGRGESKVLEEHEAGGLAVPSLAVDISKDGGMVASGGPGGQVVIRYLEKGDKDPLRLSGAEDSLARPISSVQFSPDGTKLLTASWDGGCHIWDTKTGTKLASMRSPGVALVQASFDPTGERIAIARADGIAMVWWLDGRSAPLVLKGHKNRITAIAWSPDAKRILTASSDGTARLWRTDQEGAAIRVLNGHKGTVTAVAFNRDGDRILTTSENGTARVWSTGREASPDVFMGHQGAVTTGQFSPDGRKIATGSVDQTVRVWSIDRSLPPTIFVGHASAVRSVRFSLDGTMIASASDDGTARIWRTAGALEPAVLGPHRGALLGRGPRQPFDPSAHNGLAFIGEDGKGEDEVVSAAPVVDVYEQSVSSVALSPDGQSVATGSEDGLARVWDGDLSAEPLVFRGHREGVEEVAFSTDGRHLLARSRKALMTWPVRSPGEAVVFDCNRTFVSLKKLAGDDQYAALGGEDGTVSICRRDGTITRTLRHSKSDSVIGLDAAEGLLLSIQLHEARIWDLGDGAPIAVFQAGKDRTFSGGSIGPFARKVLTWSSGSMGRATGEVQIWDRDGRREPIRLNGHSAVIVGANWSHNRQLFATFSEDRTAKIWSLDHPGSPLASLVGHINTVKGAVFGPKDDVVLTWSDDGTARIWAIDGASLPRVLAGHVGTLNDAVMSADGERVVTASTDGTARVWSIAADGVREKLRRSTWDCLPEEFRVANLGETRARAKQTHQVCIASHNAN